MIVRKQNKSTFSSTQCTKKNALFFHHEGIPSVYNNPRTTIPTPPIAAAAAMGMLVGAAKESEVSVAEARAFEPLLAALAMLLDAEAAAPVAELRARLAEALASPVAVAI